ncbi:hypothetical protein KI387_044429, partial [Taxus chinensis]
AKRGLGSFSGIRAVYPPSLCGKEAVNSHKKKISLECSIERTVHTDTTPADGQDSKQ